MAPGDILHRFYGLNRGPIYYDPGDGGRFNAPDGSYGVLYCAKTIRGAFAETFLRHPGRRLLPEDLITQKGCVRIRVAAKLELVRFSGPGLAILGATAEVTHAGLPYDVPQAWSSALHGHPATLAGMEYRSRHDDDEACYAVFERAKPAIEEHDRTTDLLSAAWFWQVMDHYEVGLAP